ncbi:hypothetical protein EI94DRAFT_1708730 [Lactarius quietus]|nr:hypothetical protein EI94DRAFT_1708730 [Lactarius quietus]
MYGSRSLPPLPPPPYSGFSSYGSGTLPPSPSHRPPLPRPLASLAPHQLLTVEDMPSRPPSRAAPPEPWADVSFAAQVSAKQDQISSQVTGSTLSSSRSFTGTSSSLSLSIPSFPPPPPIPPDINFSLPTPSRSKSASSRRSRSAFPFSASKLSKATRNATAWFSENAARKGTADATFEDEQKKRRTAESGIAVNVTKVRAEGDDRGAGIRAQASEEVKLSIRTWLTRDFPNEECNAVLQKCDQICSSGGLDFSVVLQEPLIDGKPPVYWAILNGTASSRSSNAALHALVLSLLECCQPLKEATIASTRLACMLTSNNALLQHLFWHFPALSPLTRSDAMLLSSGAGGDVVDVDETQDGTGTFGARIQIRRFRLRMRVSKFVKIEFVTSDRLWTVTFSVGSKNTIGQSESQWLLSFGLGAHSVPAWVDGDFLVLRRLPATETGDNNYEPTFSLPLGYNPCKLQPGSENAIKIRLDEGPMRPHLLNESLAMVDRDGTLHAQFNVRLTQAQHSIPTPPSTDISDGASLRSSAQKSTKSMKSTKSRARSLFSLDRRDPDLKEKKVYTSLRRGGR